MGGAATESLARGSQVQVRETEKGERDRGERWWVGMVAAGGAGLNINPRGRPGHAPVLVRFHLNSRNHAAAVARSSVPAKNEKPRVQAKRKSRIESRTRGDGAGRWR